MGVSLHAMRFVGLDRTVFRDQNDLIIDGLDI